MRKKIEFYFIVAYGLLSVMSLLTGIVNDNGIETYYDACGRGIIFILLYELYLKKPK